MKRRNRSVQHKETSSSEVQKANEIRKENLILRRTVARLQKEIEKRVNSIPEPDIDAPVQPEIPKSKLPSCPECGNMELKKVKLGAKTLNVCVRMFLA